MGLLDGLMNWALVKKTEFLEYRSKANVLDLQKLRPLQDSFAGRPFYVPQKGELESLYRLAYDSDILRTVIDKIGFKVFRNGLDWKPKFVKKCTNETCLKEYQYEVEECESCFSPVREPSEEQKQIAEPFIKKANQNGQTLLEVSKQVNDDMEITDNGWIIVIKYYAFDVAGNILFSVPKEIVRGDPLHMRFVANNRAVLGLDANDRPVRICPLHRDPVYDKAQEKCRVAAGGKLCGLMLQPAWYRQESEKIIYYLSGEVIFSQKYTNGLLYGYPPIYTLWRKADMLLAMDEYLRIAYGDKKPPKGVLLVNTQNSESFKKEWEWFISKTKTDPHNVWPLAVEQAQKQGKLVEFIDFMRSLQDMQFTEARNEFRKEAASFYGVSPVFLNNVEVSGGLNNEGLQYGVTNEAAERGQTVFDEKFYPRLLEQIGVTDWELVLNPAEEQDEMSDLQVDAQKIANAQAMKNLGFLVKRDKEGNFTYSEEPLAPSGSGQPFSQPEILNEPQRFHGEPAELQRAKSITAAKAESQNSQEKYLKEELEETWENFIEKLDFRKKPSKEKMEEIVKALTGRFGRQLKNKSNAQIRKLYLDAMEDVRKESNMDFLFGQQDKNAIELLAKSKIFSDAYQGMSDSVVKKINKVIKSGFENPEFFSLNKIVENMKAVANEEEYRLERIARTETQHVRNVARANSYMKFEDFENQKFKWIGPDDHRTTQICKAIKTKTTSGVPLSELKQIVEDTARQYDQNFEVRDWTPHINCRHYMLRVVS